MFRNGRISSISCLNSLLDHGLLLGLTDNDHTQYVNAVSDTGSINLTLTGQSISGVVIPGGVDHNTLLNVHQDVNTTASPAWVGATLSGLTPGSVLFAGVGGVVSQDNDKLFWDDTNKILIIGSNTPNDPTDKFSVLDSSSYRMDTYCTGTGSRILFELKNATDGNFIQQAVYGSTVAGTTFGANLAGNAVLTGFGNIVMYGNKSASGEVLIAAGNVEAIRIDADQNVTFLEEIIGGTVVSHTSFPVLTVRRIANGIGTYGAISLDRRTASGNAPNGFGIGQFFRLTDGGGTHENFAGFFGARWDVATAGSEIGELIFTPAWHNDDPFNDTPTLILTAVNNGGPGTSLFHGTVEIDDPTPYLTLHNSTHEDSDGGRESRLNFKGEQSGGEETTLARIEVGHDGTGDNQLGRIIASVNTGAGLAEAMRIDSNLAAFFAKIKLTEIGGYAVKLTNKTGGNTVAGQLVVASFPLGADTDDAFETAATNDNGVFGIILDAGVADSSEAWIVVSGIADVLMDGGGSARGDRIISSVTAGSADVWNVGGAVATHFQEIGHCIETRVGAGLARCVLHFN